MRPFFIYMAEPEIPYIPQHLVGKQPPLAEYREHVRDQCRRFNHSGLFTKAEKIALAGSYARSESVAQAAAKIINERLRTGML